MIKGLGVQGLGLDVMYLVAQLRSLKEFKL